MSVTRLYEPLFTFSHLGNIFDETFKAHSSGCSDAFERHNVSRVLRPRMDLHEDPEGNSITATFELPGLTKDQVNIEVRQNCLTVSGEIPESAEKTQGGYVIKERRSGKFSRALTLPERTQTDAVKACMKDGILTITFPKSSPGQEPQRVDIA